MSHKNDPDYHDQRAKTLLEASHHLKKLSEPRCDATPEFLSGIAEAAVELRRMATNARRQHKKVSDVRRQQSRDSAAKAEAFGFGR